LKEIPDKQRSHPALDQLLKKTDSTVSLPSSFQWKREGREKGTGKGKEWRGTLGKGRGLYPDVKF